MKTKHYLRHFFNMIEVSLALGITAVGVMGAITILPIALKTTNSTTYAAYLSDAANMVFMAIDDHLNETCYYLRYEDEHKDEADAEKLQEIRKDRKNAFANLFETNEIGSKNLNSALELNSDPKTNLTGVHVVHEIKDNHGLIAFYPAAPDNDISITLPDEYADPLLQSFGRPLFAARYRIVVTNLENDDEYKMDGLRKLVEVNTEPQYVTFTDARTGKTTTLQLPGARVVGGKRYVRDLSSDELKESNQLMKRIYVEFSWPANAAYSARSKKTFVKEYYMVD